MPKKSYWLIGLLCLLASAGARAGIDGWVLALTWHPGFCAQNAKMAECQIDEPPRLVLHGLWPESERGTGEFCDTSPSLRKLDSSRKWCRLPALDLSETTEKALDAAMPGRAACLDRHEWVRHGSCSAMNADRYFLAAATLVERVNGTELGKYLTENAGKKVGVIELSRAVENDVGLQGRKAYSFICRGRSSRLTAVWISMTSSGPWVFPQPTALRIQKSTVGHRCPENGMIMIDGNP